MPFLKSPKRPESWKCSDELAQKKGILHTVYSINGDEYTGEWLNNKKHGIHPLYFSYTLIPRTKYETTSLDQWCCANSNLQKYKLRL